ncbi:MAG: hypothetical protein U5L96_19515 [Owenweeksia sp.]|nr:hypothetical protein [Owenweeksia sp.]
MLHYLAVLVYGGKLTDILIDWGPMLRSKNIEFDFIIGSTEERFFTYAKESGGLFSKDDYHVTCYNRGSFTQVYDVLLENFEYRDEEVQFKRAYLDPQGRVILYFMSYDKRADRKYLVYSAMDQEGNMGPIELLAELEAEKRREGNFSIQTCKDSSLVMVYMNPLYERRENEKFQDRSLQSQARTTMEKRGSLALYG